MSSATSGAQAGTSGGGNVGITSQSFVWIMVALAGVAVLVTVLLVVFRKD